MEEIVNLRDLDVEEDSLKLWLETMSIIHLHRDNPLPEDIEKIVLDFLNREDADVAFTNYYAYFEVDDVIMSLWIANKYYAYAQSVRFQKGDKEPVELSEVWSSKKIKMRLIAIEKAYFSYLKEKKSIQDKTTKKEKINQIKDLYGVK